MYIIICTNFFLLNESIGKSHSSLLHKANLNEVNVVFVYSFGWSVVHSATGVHVLGVSDGLSCVEIGQNVHKAAPIPVVSDPTTIVTLARHVCESIKWYGVILINEHL